MRSLEQSDSVSKNVAYMVIALGHIFAFQTSPLISQVQKEGGDGGVAGHLNPS